MTPNIVQLAGWPASHCFVHPFRSVDAHLLGTDAGREAGLFAAGP
jgi:hypothetical protein